MAFLEDITKGGQAVGQGLLDVLNAITSPVAPILQQLPKINAAYQASIGNPIPMQMMQQQQQRDLMQQLMSQQLQARQPQSQKTEMPQIQMTPELQSAFASGDRDLFNKEIKRQESRSNMEMTIRANKRLQPEERQSLLGQLESNVPPTDVGRQMTELMKTRRVEERMLGKEKRQEERLLSREERKKQEQEAKMPGNILADGLSSGEISVDNPVEIIGYLSDKGVKIPGKPGEQQVFIKNLLSAPRFKQYQKQQEPGFIARLGSSLLNLFTPTSGQQQTPTAPQTTPATAQPKVRRFVPGKGLVD